MPIKVLRKGRRGINKRSWIGIPGSLDADYPAYPRTTLADFTQKSNFYNYGATPYDQLSNVSDPDGKYGPTAVQVVIRDAGVANPQYLAPAAALAVPVDVRSGNILFNYKPLLNFGVNSTPLDRFQVELHSSGTPGSPTANFHQLTLGIGNLPSFLRGRSTAIDAVTSGRWQTESFPIVQFSASGSGADLSAIRFIRLAVRCSSTNHVIWLVGKTEFQANPRSKAACIFRFDDAFSSAWTYARSALGAYGWGAMLCPGDIKNLVNSPGRLTDTQIKTLCDEGWQNGSQAWSTEDVAILAAMTAQQRRDEFKEIRFYGQVLGVRPDTYDGSYFTGFVPTRLDVFPQYAEIFRTAQRFDTGVGADPPVSIGNAYPFGDRYNIAALNGATSQTYWPSGTVAARLQNHVDQAILNKGVAIIAYHDELASAGEFRTAFDTTLAYLNTKRSDIDVTTMARLIV